MGGFEVIFGIVPVVVIVMFVMATSVRILRDYERAGIFRFGQRANAVFNPGGDGSGPGLVLLIPFIDKMVRGPPIQGDPHQWSERLYRRPLIVAETGSRSYAPR